MSRTPQESYELARKQATSLRPAWMVKKAAAALAAIVDAEWLTARNPRYTPASISLATMPTELLLQDVRLARRPSVRRQMK